MKQTHAMLVLGWALSSAVGAGAQVLSCPPGTDLKHSGSEQSAAQAAWCVLPGRTTRHGPFRRWHRNGELAESGQFVDGKEDGPWRTFWASGKPHEEGTYSKSKKEGRWTTWYEDGSVRRVAHYRNGDLHGPFESWRQNGSRDLRAEYVDGRLHGKLERRYESGRPAEVSHWVDGKWDGPYRSFWPTGHPCEAGSYTRGEKDGSWTTWHPNGKKKSEGYYEVGKKTKLWRKYHSNGAPSSEVTYVDGEPNGLFVSWYHDGVLRMRGRFENGKKVDDWEKNLEYDPFHPGGTTATIRDLLASGRKAVWFPSFDCPPGTKAVEDRTVGRYTGTGCVDGQNRRQGLWRGTYSDENARRFEHTYRDGKLEGRARDWWENGQLAVDCSYVDNLLHGDFASYGWWGSIAWQGRLERSVPVGAWQQRSWENVPLLEAEFDAQGRPLRWKRWSEEGHLIETGERTGEGDVVRVRRFDRSTGYRIEESVGAVEVKSTHAILPSGHDVATPALVFRRDGASSEWSHDGALQSRGSYRDGKKEGPWLVWKRESAVAETVEFRAGKKLAN